MPARDRRPAGRAGRCRRSAGPAAGRATVLGPHGRRSCAAATWLADASIAEATKHRRGRRPLVPRRPLRARGLPGRPPAGRRVGRPRRRARRSARRRRPGAIRCPSPERFAAGLGALGIGDGQPVVAYDDQGGMAAGRLVWLLRSLGQPAALLDGGLAAWTEATGGQLRTGDEVRAGHDASRSGPGRPAAGLGGRDRQGGPLDGRSAVVLDARAPERYRGEVEPIDARPGHVPGARNAPFAANLDPGTGRFRPPDRAAPDASRRSAIGVRQRTAGGDRLLRLGGQRLPRPAGPRGAPGFDPAGPASTRARGRSGPPTRTGPTARHRRRRPASRRGLRSRRGDRPAHGARRAGGHRPGRGDPLVRGARAGRPRPAAPRAAARRPLQPHLPGHRRRRRRDRAAPATARRAAALRPRHGPRAPGDLRRCGPSASRSPAAIGFCADPPSPARRST